MVPCKALFFDIGNTLVADPFSLAIPAVADFLIHGNHVPSNKRPDLLAALQHANKTLDGLGWSHFWGEREIMRVAICSVVNNPEAQLVEDALLTYRDRVVTLYMQRAELLALSPSDLRSMLSRIRFAGLVVGLISDEREASIPRYLNVLQAADMFDFVVTSESVGVAKPSPAIFLAALERARVLPGEAVYVGNDYSRDVEGGRNVGMRVVYFTRFNPSPPGPAEDADLITDNLSDVLKFAGILT